MDEPQKLPVESIEPAKPEAVQFVTYDDFKKLDMRVGTIREVEAVEGADKLYKCQIDFNEKNSEGMPTLRQIVSGIREYFPDPNALVGKQVLYVVNLEPRTIRGVVSSGMLMAVDGPDGAPVLMSPEHPVNPGAHIR